MLRTPYQGACGEYIKLTARTPQVQKERRMFNRDSPSPLQIFPGLQGGCCWLAGWLTIAQDSSSRAQHLLCSHPACQAHLLSPASKSLPIADVDFVHQSWGCTTNFTSLASERTDEAGNTHITQHLVYGLLNFIFLIHHLGDV